MSLTAGLADRAYRLIPTHTLTGTARWYKVLELELTEDSARNVTLIVSDAGGSYTGILRIYFNRSDSNNTITLSGSLSWLDIGGPWSEQDACYNIDNTTNTYSLYIRKRSGSTGGLSFQVLRSVSRGGSSFSLVDSFKSESISTLPDTVSYAWGPTGSLWYPN